MTAVPSSATTMEGSDEAEACPAAPPLIPAGPAAALELGSCDPEGPAPSAEAALETVFEAEATAPVPFPYPPPAARAGKDEFDELAVALEPAPTPPAAAVLEPAVDEEFDCAAVAVNVDGAVEDALIGFVAPDMPAKLMVLAEDTYWLVNGPMTSRKLMTQQPTGRRKA
jgi:hypothetical protein